MVKRSDAAETITGAVIARFRHAARRVPAYAALLREHAVDPRSVTDLDSFARRVPLTDKGTLFDRPLADLCVDGRLTSAATVYASSGHSGTFSFGADSAVLTSALRRRVDALLDHHFAVRSLSTLLINALPPGVAVPSSVATIFETGGRIDVAIAAMRAVAPAFEQVVILGEHPLLKSLLEQGRCAGVDWPRHRVRLVTGGEVVPENFRGYACGFLGLGKRPVKSPVLVSLGISEVSLSLGQETDWTRGVRRIVHSRPAVRRALFGDAPFAPTLVQYDPQSVYIETPVVDGRPRLVITTLDPRRMIPLIRYCTGDWAGCFTVPGLRRGLSELGATSAPAEGDPRPVLAVWGRGDRVLHCGRDLYPEQIKEAMYADARVAGVLTANFRLRHGARAAAVACFQLQKGAAPSALLKQRLRKAMARWVRPELRIELRTFDDFAARYGGAPSQKFRYIAHSRALCGNGGGP